MLKKLLSILILNLNIFAQVQIFQSYNNNYQDTTFFSNTSSRKYIKLNKNWSIQIDDNKTTVDLPAVYLGERNVSYINYFTINANEYNKNQFDLLILGLNYSAEIALNDNVIYKHSGGTFPFYVNLPKDLIRTNSSNKIEIKISNFLSSDETLPTKQHRWLPVNTGGIFRDIYLVKKSNISILFNDINTKVEANKNSASIFIGSKIFNYQLAKKDSSATLSIYYQIISPNNNVIVSYQTPGFLLNLNKEKYIGNYFTIPSPILWSPNYPAQYKIKIQLLSNGVVIDEYNHFVQLYNLVNTSNGLFLNNEPFTIQGVTYVPVNQHGYLQDYNQIVNDIKLIKNAGFNAIRFTSVLPNPITLKLCADYGLLVFVDLPVNSVPEKIINENSFKDRVKNHFQQIINFYKNYSIIAGIGLGSGYLSNSEEQLDFVNSLSHYLKRYNLNKLTYASFIGYDFKKTIDLNFYGIEVFNKLPEIEKLEKLQNIIPLYKIIFSDITYSAYKKGMNGYQIPHSYEAQAKFFFDAIDYCNKNKINIFFINTMFDYRTEFSALSSGYDKDNITNIGITDENRQINRITYRVIASKLNNGDNVTIPIGTIKADEPVIFIILGIALIVFVGYFINSSRKFREDTTRALLRQYNFFADLRDLRLVTFSHTNLLLFVILSSFSLILINLFYFWKDSFLFEKIILSFGKQYIMDLVSFISWNPLYGFLILIAILFIKFILLTMLIKIASLTLKNKVFYSRIYTSATWALLPTILLLPVGIVLVKVLNFNIINIYIYIGLLVFVLWLIQRLLQSIYVLFDILPFKVYLGFITVFVILFGLFFVYFQTTESTVDYLLYYIKQNSLL
jgi:hypothetical protein